MKLFAAQLEGHSNPKDIRATSSFIAGGVAGMISQSVSSKSCVVAETDALQSCSLSPRHPQVPHAV